ncbi:MAG: hydrolase TatD [Anaeromyxobacter sp. RBG_16_69_14]|nr:MAG: hydrolase TatD [Anaeromyxobacter sp. RBG_16_69_14]
MNFFDAELHPLPLRQGDLDDLRFFGVAGALAPADDAVTPATREALRRAWDALAPGATQRLRRAGIAGFAAVGIHPRCIPWRGFEALLAELPDFLGRRHVLAMGAIGLEEGGAREEAVFVRQLELARELRLRVLVHTPWRRKERITRRVLTLLREHEIEPRLALVTRADARTVRMIRACGYAAGLSLSAGEGDAIDDAVQLVRSLGPGGLVLGSGAGDGAGDLLSLPRAAGRMAKAGLSQAVIRRVCCTNALQFLGLDESIVKSGRSEAGSGASVRGGGTT